MWNLHEWPNLGSAVTQVIRVNPDNDRKKPSKELRQRGLNNGMFDIIIKDAAAVATIRRITGVVAKAGVAVAVDVRINSRF